MIVEVIDEDFTVLFSVGFSLHGAILTQFVHTILVTLNHFLIQIQIFQILYLGK